jgi:uncharacterized protein YndB with AHSA1/START domain
LDTLEPTVDDKEVRMPDIIHRIGIRAPEAGVFRALSALEGLSHWWTEEVRGESRPGGRIEFVFRDGAGGTIGRMVMEVMALDAPGSVRWRCVDGPPDWIGTEIEFGLSTQDGLCILMFAHRNWAEATESMAHCSMKWAVFLLSLKEYVETGKGRPSPGDLKIDNWN